jgi:transcriptional regulator with XRE-family HTH domain
MSDAEVGIGARLRLARTQAGLSQIQVAKLMGMHRPTVSEIEAGRRRVQLDEVAKFAELFHVAVPWLLGMDFESTS